MFNVQVAVSTALLLLMLYGLRRCSTRQWCCLVLLPAALYGFFAERTKATLLEGKVVLVTGASSGLGRALVLEASRRGARKVILVSRTQPKLEAVATECAAAATHGAFEAVVEAFDVTSADAARAAVQRITAAHGALDLLVNNAGSGAWKHVEETTPEEAAEMMACPYGAAFTATSLFVPAMAAAGTGHVMNVASAASELGFRGAVGYGTARWAIRGFSRNLVLDLAPLGIGVTHLNAAEITGTEYFSDAPGKAGRSSRDRIPELFKLVDRLGLNYDTAQVAAAGLDAVENGWSWINVPGFLLVPSKWLVDFAPWLLEQVCALGGAQTRAPGAAPSGGGKSEL